MIFTLLDIALHTGVWVSTKVIYGTYYSGKYAYDWYYDIEEPESKETKEDKLKVIEKN